MVEYESFLRDAIRRTSLHEDVLRSEDRFQELLAEQLVTCARECRMTFDPPAIPARSPSEDDLAELTKRGIALPTDGKDPCGGRARRLDLLWEVGGAQVPIELKATAERKADVYGYYFLKDLHRLERLRRIEGCDSVSPIRFAVFLTSVSDYWGRKTLEPEPFRLTHGRTIPPGYWVQYNQPSPVTRWHGYPPFHLSDEYTFEWTDLGRGVRYLLTRVRQHRVDRDIAV